MVQKWLTTATLLYFLRYSASNSLIFQVLSLSSCGDSFTAFDVRSSRHLSCFSSQVNSSWVLRCFSQASLKLALRLSMNHNSELSFIWLKSQSGNCLIFQSLWVLMSQEYLNASARMGCTSTRIFLPPKIYRQVSRVRWQGDTSTKSISSSFSCSLALLHCSFPSQVMLQSMNSLAYDTFLLKSSSQMHQSQVKSQLFVALYSRNPRLKLDCACLMRMMSLVSCFMAIVEYLQSKPTEKLIKFITHYDLTIK